MKTKIAVVLVYIALSSSLARATDGSDVPQANTLVGDQVIPMGEAAKKANLPGDNVIPDYPGLDPSLRANIEKARSAYNKLRESAPEAPAPEPRPELASEIVALPSEVKAAEPQVVETKPKIRQTRATQGWSHLPSPKTSPEAGFRDEAGGVRVFTRNLPNKKAGKETFTLPSTSIALATLLYGIEATANEERLVPAELNYAWLGPNAAVVEMKNCRLWIKVKGDYSTERIYGSAETISCRSPSGETFDIPISAHMVDKEEEYLGARGALVARGKALASAMSFLSDGVQAFGSAMASAQVQTDVASSGPYGSAEKASNVGGDRNKYVAGQTIAGSTAKFLNWWIDYYQSLSPTIAIGPGKKIYLAVHGTIEIPKIFFGSRIEQGQFQSMVDEWKSQEKSGGKVNTTSAISAPNKPDPQFN